MLYRAWTGREIVWARTAAKIWGWQKRCKSRPRETRHIESHWLLEGFTKKKRKGEGVTQERKNKSCKEKKTLLSNLDERHLCGNPEVRLWKRKKQTTARKHEEASSNFKVAAAEREKGSPA